MVISMYVLFILFFSLLILIFFLSFLSVGGILIEFTKIQGPKHPEG